MTSDADARRIASGPPPSQLVAAQGGAPKPSTPQASGSPVPGPMPDATAPHDPLQLCIFATIALLGWLGGPVTLIVFAAVGFTGYWTAWRAGLTRSKCWLRDTRLVLTYLGVLVAAGAWGVYAVARSLMGF